MSNTLIINNVITNFFIFLYFNFVHFQKHLPLQLYMSYELVVLLHLKMIIFHFFLNASINHCHSEFYIINHTEDIFP